MYIPSNFMWFLTFFGDFWMSGMATAPKAARVEDTFFRLPRFGCHCPGAACGIPRPGLRGFTRAFLMRHKRGRLEGKTSGFLELIMGRSTAIWISMLDGEWWYHDNIWQHDFLKIDVLPNQLMAMPPCPMALRQVVQELLKPLSDKKAPDRARLGALTCLALLAEQREGAGSREVSWSREGRSSVFEVLGSCNYQELWTNY